MFSICVDILVVTSTLYVIVWVESYVLRISRKHRFKQGESLWPLRTNSNDFGAHTRYTLSGLSAKDVSKTVVPPDSCPTPFLSLYMRMFLNARVMLWDPGPESFNKRATHTLAPKNV